MLSRLWKSLVQQPQLKGPNALRVGILGTPAIAQAALIEPAKTHPEVIVQAVAASSREAAEAFAKLHDIPQVLDSYQAMLDEPSIDAVYIALPNSLRSEYTHQAAMRKKHVLVETPAAANSEDVATLWPIPWLHGLVFPTLADNSPPIVTLEATHFRFHPAWQFFLRKLDQRNILGARVVAKRPRKALSLDDVQFRYDLGGGSLMDLGAYNMAALIDVFGIMPELCLQCEMQQCDPPHDMCDMSAKACFVFENGGTGLSESSLQQRNIFPEVPFITVTMRPEPFPIENGEKPSNIPHGFERFRSRTVTFYNFLDPGISNRIEVEDECMLQPFDVKKGEDTVKRWTVKRTYHIYSFKDAGMDSKALESEDCWTSYRYQLEEFVNQIRGRPGSGVWMSITDSQARAFMTDMAYKRAGFEVRLPISSQQPRAMRMIR